MIRSIALCLALLAPVPALAQQATPEAGDEGFDLMEEGARLLFRGLMQEMEPALDDFRDFAEETMRDLGPRFEEFTAEMGEGLAEVLGRLDDIRNYEAPEILENGDILIRRRSDAPPYVPPEEDADPGPEIDL